tara:strand:- start:203 stop:520 length:318 start_codon:yes stop_codon:yes gene_type:complete
MIQSIANQNEKLISERENDINNIAHGVQEISELFQDMSILVRTNGETINNIESNIEFAVNNTQQANTELVKANKYQKKNSKYRIYFIFFCLLLLIFIILIFCFSS